MLAGPHWPWGSLVGQGAILLMITSFIALKSQSLGLVNRPLWVKSGLLCTSIKNGKKWAPWPFSLLSMFFDLQF